MREFIPARTNTLSKLLTMGLFIISLAAMLLSTINGLPYHSVMQLISIVLLATAIALLGRYEFRRYIYAIVYDEEEKISFFTVTEIKKRSRITVCRISLREIEKVVDIEQKEKKSRKSDRSGRKIYNYCVDIAPAHTCRIFSRECGESLLIDVSFIPELYEILKEHEDRSFPEQH